METFDWPYFTFGTKYPESTSKFKFGRSYEFTVPPASPDQRVFTLTLPGLRYIETTPGSGILDIVTDPDLNLGRLEDFYVRHKEFQTFLWIHPAHGQLSCKFNNPLEVPSGISGGTGVVEDLSLELIEIP